MPNPTLDDLKKKQQKLIKELQKQHPEIYAWFVKKRIDLEHLGQYASNIAAALALATATTGQPKLEQPQDIPKVQAEERTLTRQELRGKSDTQRAQLVWNRYGEHINQAARKYNLDPQLIFATIMIESGGDTYAIRHEPRLNDASYGLGQMLYSTARGIGFTGAPSELFDPEVNIDLIGKYHRRNLDVYGKLTPEQLTVAYNTGSPHKRPYPGHLAKFNTWYNRTANLEIDLT